MQGTITMFPELGVRTDKPVFIKLPIMTGDMDGGNQGGKEK